MNECGIGQTLITGFTTSSRSQDVCRRTRLCRKCVRWRHSILELVSGPETQKTMTYIYIAHFNIMHMPCCLHVTSQGMHTVNFLLSVMGRWCLRRIWVSARVATVGSVVDRAARRVIRHISCVLTVVAPAGLPPETKCTVSHLILI